MVKGIFNAFDHMGILLVLNLTTTCIDDKWAIIWRGWSGGAKVLGKLSVPGRPTYLDYSRARAYCTCSRCGWGCLEFFFSSITSLFFHPLSGRRPDID